MGNRERAPLVLGIETSCDETAAAIVDGDRRIHADLVLSQIEDHRPYGGVVPEIAARAHIDHLDDLIRRAMAEAGLEFRDLTAVAATAGPGLIGGVMVGLMTGKAIAAAARLPFIGVNHLEGHALSVRLVSDVSFPYLLLLVSGGHCQLLTVEGPGRYRRLGTTIDDAAGEAFDKTAKMLGLGFPGGPAVERAARAGDPTRFPLPTPMVGRPGADFSFSGLKTAVRREIEKLGHPLKAQEKADLAAAFQNALTAALVDRTGQAMGMFRELTGVREPERPPLVVAGGVAANGHICAALEDLARDRGFRLMAPPPRLCTDNAAMIAWAGIERLRLGHSDPLDLAARARWPLDPAAPPAIGAGVKA